MKEITVTTGPDLERYVPGPDTDRDGYAFRSGHRRGLDGEPPLSEDQAHLDGFFVGLDDRLAAQKAAQAAYATAWRHQFDAGVADRKAGRCDGRLLGLDAAYTAGWNSEAGTPSESDLWRWGYRVGGEDQAANKPPRSPFREGTPANSGYYRGYNDQAKVVA